MTSFKFKNTGQNHEPTSPFLQHVEQTSLVPLALEIVNAEGCNLFDAGVKIY